MKYLVFIFLFTFISCSTMLTPVDKPNMKRFNHDQKIVEGLTRSEVLERFGTPSEATEDEWGDRKIVIWSYYKSPHCFYNGPKCAVYFEDDKVIKSFNFRMEYNYTIVGR